MAELPANGRYAMFLRKSREDAEAERTGKFETLAKHRTVLERLAESMGVAISQTYEEIVSGSDLSKRDGAQQMLADVRAGKWDGVFAFDLQRVTRGDMIDQGTVVLAFQLSHTLIITPQKIYDLRDELDGSFAEMEMLFGRMELARITRRLVTGKEEAVRQGQYLGSIAPFGWDKAVISRKKTLVPNADNARMVSWYERIAAKQASPKEIAEEMNDAGIPSPRGKMWDRSLIARVIRNPVNKGFVRWNARRTIEVFGDGDEKEKKRIKADEIVVPGLHRGTVNPDLWQRAVDAIDGRTMPALKMDLTLKDPLATLLVCKRCGRSMRRMKSNRPEERYTHSQVNRKDCWQIGAKMDTVIDLLIDAIESIANDTELRIGTERHISTVGICEHDLESERGSVDTLFRLVEKGMITDEEFARRKQLAEERIAAAEKRLRQARTADRNASRSIEFVVSLRRLIGELRNYKGRAQEVNDALRAIIDRIEYEKDPETGEIRLGVYFV